jgi:hypothetical protein
MPTKHTEIVSSYTGKNIVAFLDCFFAYKVTNKKGEVVGNIIVSGKGIVIKNHVTGKMDYDCESFAEACKMLESEFDTK